LLVLLAGSVPTAFLASGGTIRRPLVPTILSLELAHSGWNAAGLVGRWSEEGLVSAAIGAVYWDFLFIFFYAALIGLSCAMVSARLRRELAGRFWPAVGDGLSWGLLAAAFLDCWENRSMLPMLVDLPLAPRPAWEPFAYMAWRCATLKFGLIAFGASYVGLGVAAIHWAFLRELGRVLVLCRSSGLVLALGSVCLIAVPQGRDAVLRLGEGYGPVGGAVARASAIVGVSFWALSTWYWARVLLYLRLPGTPPTLPALRTNVPRVLGALAFLASAVAFGRAARTSDAAGTGPATIALGALTLLSLIFLALFCAFVLNRRALLTKVGVAIDSAPTAQVETLADVWTGTRWTVVGSTCASVSVLGLLTLWPVCVGQTAGSIAILLLALTNWALLGSLVVAVGARYRFPSLTAIVLVAALFGLFNDNHDVRMVGRGVPPTRIALEARLNNWRHARKAEGQTMKIPLFLVVAEGGGARAAFWTGSALAALQDQNAFFAGHVFAVSSVSGSSLGAGVFSALLASGWPDEPCKPPKLPNAGNLPSPGPFQCRAEQILSEDFLSPILAMAVGPDLLQRLLPFPVRRFDRSLALEGAWEEAWRRGKEPGDRLAHGFLDLWKGDEGLALVPLLFLNGTHVETGRRLVAAPVVWPRKGIPEAGDLIAMAGEDLRLSSAIHGSARFPYVSPAGTFWDGHGGTGHIVDGGYFENAGATTALDLLSLVSMKGEESEPEVVPYVIYLRNDPYGGREATLEEDRLGGRDGLGDSLIELHAPVTTFLKTRAARGRVALERLRKTLPEGHFIELATCERSTSDGPKEPLPLGWQLSDVSRSAMRRQLACGCPGAENRDAMKKILAVLPVPSS